MAVSRRPFSATAALHQVFVAPLVPSSRQHCSRQAVRRPSSTTQLLNRATPSTPLTQRRSYAEAAKRRLPFDDQITARQIHIVDEKGSLSDPTSTWSILDRLDRRTHTLITVAAGAGDAARGPTIPICKIVTKQSLREADKAKSKKKDNPAAIVKTIELNWAIDGNDLRHRLDKMKGFLEKGNKVEVIFAAKRRGRKATEKEASDNLAAVKAAVEEVPGSRELKKMEGAVLAQATLYFEGRQKAAGESKER